MKVAEVMTNNPLYCRRETDLGAAAELLWNGNCGFLPIVEDSGRVIGAVTDRDICIGLGTRNRLPGQVSVGEIATDTLAACKPEDDIHQALAAMAAKKVRRLAVVGAKGELAGVLSLDDVVTKGLKSRAGGEVSPDEFTSTLREIVAAQRRRVPAQKAA